MEGYKREEEEEEEEEEERRAPFPSKYLRQGSSGPDYGKGNIERAVALFSPQHFFIPTRNQLLPLSHTQRDARRAASPPTESLGKRRGGDPVEGRANRGGAPPFSRKDPPLPPIPLLHPSTPSTSPGFRASDRSGRRGHQEANRWPRR